MNVFFLVPAHPGSPRQRAVKRLLLLLGEEAVASPSTGNTVVHFNDLHVFGYNSAGSEQI